VDLTESYKSLNESLYHGGYANNCKVNLIFVDSETITPDNVRDTLSGADGILVPGGFGSRGVPGKISAVQYARECRIPFFGICLGMQIAMIEFARNVAGIPGAHSSEFDENAVDPVIYLMMEWYDERAGAVQKRDASSQKGATMRLGAYACNITPGSLAHRAYGVDQIVERHRHRYEFNAAYRSVLERHGLLISGISPTGELIEIVEIADHPWFLGCQFHPEFKSRPMEPHPLFRDFIAATVAYKNKKGSEAGGQKSED